MKLFFNLLAITVFCQTIFAGSFKQGYYYTNDGKKIEGYIKFNAATFSVFGSKQSNIRFAETEDRKAIKLTAGDIASFVVGDDSFTVVTNIKINEIEGEYAKDFAKVIISGKMNLYIHMSESYDGRTSYKNNNYVFSKDNKTYYGFWNVKKQREELANLFSDVADIKARILNKEFDQKILELVKEYNSR